MADASDFVAFFFDRPIVGHEDSFDLFSSGIDHFVASDPATLVSYLQTMCFEFAGLAKLYSPEQLDQGLWAVFGATLRFGQYLFDLSIDSKMRTACVESMYLPFRDVVSHQTGDIRGTFFWMWWDMILHDFPLMPNEYKKGYVTLTNDQELMIEAIFQTLSKILEIDHQGCQVCAIHGLGHLYHPSSSDLLARYLDKHASEFSDEDVKWIEAARENAIL